MDRTLLEVVALGPGDEPELERFLAQHADSSGFLLANSYHAGIVDEGEPLQGTYVAARERDCIVAVAACFWNGNVVVQGRRDAVGECARVAVARSGRPVRGINGPHALVVAARDALGMSDRATTLDSREDLFALALADLRVPPPLADGRWLCRHFADDDRDELSAWSVAYEVEALGLRRSDDDVAAERARFDPRGAKWVLVVDGQRVARCGFNAQHPGFVQVGGVYTPPALRGRGYGRAVVAGALLEARAGGVTRSILFTGLDNPAARAAYLALGYRIVGDYALVLFDV